LTQRGAGSDDDAVGQLVSVDRSLVNFLIMVFS
jgi:hypothetical protein